MSFFQAFAPAFGTGQVLTPAAGNLQAILVGGPTGPKQVRLTNSGAALCYVRTYNAAAATDKASAGVATTADFPIVAGQTSTITRANEHDRLAYISATGTTLLMVQGDGL